MATLTGAENALGASLGRLFALAEAYPDLKANQNMMQLSEELTSTENKVAFLAPGVQRRGHELQQPA
jgi:LemA protein